jgi:hypothetical protein
MPNQIPFLTKGCYVRLKTLRAVPGGAPACPWPIYAPSLWDDVLSLPVGYDMEGFLLDDLVQRGYIQLDRRIRCRVARRGIFTSTRILRIAGGELTTHNSVYEVTAVEPPRTAMLGEQSAGTKRSRRLATPSLPRTDET